MLTESNIPIPKLWALNLQKNLDQLCVSLLYKRLFFQFDNRWRCERFMPKRNNFCLFFSYELNISKSCVIYWKNSQKNHILQIQYLFFMRFKSYSLKLFKSISRGMIHISYVIFGLKSFNFQNHRIYDEKITKKPCFNWSQNPWKFKIPNFGHCSLVRQAR